MANLSSAANASKLKMCFCPLCPPEGVAIPISTYLLHQKNAERNQQREAAQTQSSSPAGSSGERPGSLGQHAIPSSSIAGYSQTSSFVEELRSMMTPTNLSGLKFLGDPVQDGSYIPQNALGKGGPSGSPFALAPYAPRNREHLARENRLRIVAAELDLRPAGPERDEILHTVQIVDNYLEFQKVLAWSRQRNAQLSAFVDTDIHYQVIIPHRHEPFLAGCYMSTMLLSTFGSLTQNSAKALLAGFQSIAASSPSTQHLVRQIPKDVRDLLRHYDSYDPVIERYATCPTCFEHYSLSGHTAESLPHCTYSATRTNLPCKTPLWKSPGTSQSPVPRLVTAVQNFKHWLGRRLSHIGFEKACETAFQALGRDPMQREADGTRLQELLDDNKKPWLPGDGRELRLVFMWSNDGWNDLGNRIAGKTRSSTGIWLVNMGLPIDVRYLEENVFFLCAIPGKPNGSRLNPTLELLVTVFVEFWSPGVWFSRTAKCPAGRLVKAVVLPQVSDVTATRQAAGRGAVNVPEFCMYCMLHHDDIECSDRSKFTARDEKKQFNLAKQWKDAPSQDVRDSLEETHDIRWTPFYRLSYYRATTDNLLEPLHLFYEHLIQDCVRKCLRVHLIVNDKELSETVKEKTRERPKPEAIDAALHILRTVPDGILDEKALSKLVSQPEPVLFHLCQDLGLRYAGYRRQLAKNLANWRSSVTQDDARLKPSAEEAVAGQSLATSRSEPTNAVSSQNGNNLATTGGSGVMGSRAAGHAEGVTSNPTFSQTDLKKMPWLESLTLEEMRELCTNQGDKVRKGFNSRYADSTLTQYCVGEVHLLSAFSKMVSLNDKDVFRNAKNRNTKVVEIKKVLIETTGMLPDIREELQAFLSTLSAVSKSESSGVSKSGAQGFSTSGVSKAWLETLAPEEQQLMTSSLATAVSKQLISDNAPASIVNAARQGDARSKTVLQVYSKSLGLSTSGTVKTLAEQLKAYTSRHYAPVLPRVSRLDPEGPRRPILTTAIMTKIQHYMSLTQLPTSVDRAPLDWGTKSHGRIAGNDWLMIGTVHLPVALIPLWGHQFATPREKELLEHVMTLVSVVCIGTLRTISVADTHDFDATMLKLFESKKRLFKDETIKPYDHFALHYGDILRSYGPTPAHDGSYFERIIRRLRQFNTNVKKGEVEETYMKAYGRWTNLRSTLLDENAVSTLSHTAPLVEEFRRSSFLDKRGTKLGTLMLESTSVFSVEGAQLLLRNTSDVTLPKDVLDLLPVYSHPQRSAGHTHPDTSPSSKVAAQPALALNVQAASYGGARYCPSSHIECDSDMLFLRTMPHHNASRGGRIVLDKVAAGRIIFMFLYGHDSSTEHKPTFGRPSRSSSGTLWAIVRPYKRLSLAEAHLDAHYRAYEFGGFCCKPDFEDPPIVINISQAVCQVAKTPVKFAGVSLLHFLPLARLTNIRPHFLPTLSDLPAGDPLVGDLSNSS